MITKGDLPITIKWILNSALLVSGENGVSIVKLSPKTSVLNIPSVNEMHRGVYKCIAENAAGENSHTAEFIVNGTIFDKFNKIFLNLLFYLPSLTVNLVYNVKFSCS